VFEHRRQPLLDRKAFVKRQWRYVLVAASFVGISLVMGTVGYVAFAGQSVVDAFLNASMILAGMGPVVNYRTPAPKCSPRSTRFTAG